MKIRIKAVPAGLHTTCFICHSPAVVNLPQGASAALLVVNNKEFEATGIDVACERCAGWLEEIAGMGENAEYQPPWGIK